MYYDNILFYVDDVFYISDDPIFTMKGVQAKFKMKGDKIYESDRYRGAEF